MYKLIFVILSGDYNPLNDQNKGSRNGICKTEKYGQTELLIRLDTNGPNFLWEKIIVYM